MNASGAACLENYMPDPVRESSASNEENATTVGEMGYRGVKSDYLVSFAIASFRKRGLTSSPSFNNWANHHSRCSHSL